jgi:glycosyltransferase involved in cell wall biosynthesis
MTFGTSALRNAVDAQLTRRRWDVVVIDHLETGWVLDAVPRPGPAVVYVAHNHEASVRAAVARADDGHVLHRLALGLEAKKTARLERRVVSRSDLVVAITDADAARFRPETHRDPLVLTPGYDGEMLPARRFDANIPRQVAMITSLDWHVKRANLESFVRIADPILAHAGVRLIVVGGAPDEFVRRVEASARATTMLGRVDSVDRVLTNARVGVVAEPLGGGFKLKVLDFVHRRVPIASIAGSIEGVPLRAGTDMLEFADAGALAHGIVEAIDDFSLLEALSNAAVDRCRGAFDWSDRGRRLADALGDLRSPSRI